ncbi:MAG: DNA repair protein [Actinobacteria bacterium]|nr:DNA repair protein [Actinomycetota bacterium]
MPDALHFTNDDEANVLIATDPLALLIGFVLDQQVTVQTAFLGPLKLRDRLGRLDAGEIAAMDPVRLDAVFREPPAIHRFPGNMAQRVQALCAFVSDRYDGDAAAVWARAESSDDLRRRIGELPGFGEMKVKALGSVLAKRFGVAVAKDLVPEHPTLGDVDSREALDSYQAQKRAHKAALRAS